ncbi:MAG: 5'/3'-nucleotidase SurE [Anaerolineae bacterium]
MKDPLILVTNDDGITSRGLWAAVEALLTLGEVVVVAPDQQWSGAGRSMPPSVTGAVSETGREVNGTWVEAYAVDATPALAVVHGLLEFAPRWPDVVVSGINYGENVSIEVTASGTVGAALEAAAEGIPALSISLAVPIAYHHTGHDATNFQVAAHFARHFTRRLLADALPYDTGVLNVNVPESATKETPWRLTRLSRHRYFLPLMPDRDAGVGRPGYKIMDDPAGTEPDSDVWTLAVDGLVSVTPLSLDLTARSDFGALAERLHGEL